MKTLDKEVRVWDVYLGLESTVKNLLTSLRAVNELQNPAVRERHWQQLMNTTGVQHSLSRYILPSDLLSLSCCPSLTIYSRGEVNGHWSGTSPGYHTLSLSLTDL